VSLVCGPSNRKINKKNHIRATLWGMDFVSSSCVGGSLSCQQSPLSGRPRSLGKAKDTMNSLAVKSVFQLPFLILWVFPCASLCTGATDQGNVNRITVVFRYDDYSAKSDTTLELELFAAFATHNVPCAIAVIPYVCEGDCHNVAPQEVVPLDPRKAVILEHAVETGLLEVALHGYSHQTIRDKKHGGYTEFRGLDLTCQREKLAEGKALLERMLDLEVTCFVPPWNSYDQDTIVALNELGFRVISAGVKNLSLPSEVHDTRLKYLPATCGPHELELAVQAARTLEDHAPIIVVMIHQFDFLENDKRRGRLTLQEFSDLLKWVKSQPDVRVASMEDVANSRHDLGIDRLRANTLKRYPRLLLPSALLPSALLPGSVYVYLTPDEGIVERRRRLWIATLGLYLPLLAVSVAVGVGIGIPIFRWSRHVGWMLVLGGPVVFGGYAVRALRDSFFDAREGMILAFLLGSYFGALLAIRWVVRTSNRSRQDRTVSLRGEVATSLK